MTAGRRSSKHSVCRVTYDGAGIAYAGTWTDVGERM